MVSSWRLPLCKRAIGSERRFSIRLVFSVDGFKNQRTVCLGRFHYYFEMLAAILYKGQHPLISNIRTIAS